MVWRTVADVLLIGVALFLPWWFVLVSATALFFVFERFFELFLVAFLVDLFYAVPLPRFSEFEFVLSLCSVLLYFLLTVIKRRIRF